MYVTADRARIGDTSIEKHKVSFTSIPILLVLHKKKQAWITFITSPNDHVSSYRKSI